jgi:hypothetical protein
MMARAGTPWANRGDERMAQRVGADLLADPGAPRDPADDPSRAMAVQPPSD